MSFDKLDSFIIDINLDQSCPGNMSAAPVFILALHSVVGQPKTTLLRKNISTGALKVKHCIIEGIVMWITTDGAGLSLHCLAGKLKGSWLANLGKGAGLVVVLQAS